MSRKVALLLSLVLGVGLGALPAAAASYYPSYNNYYYFIGQRPQPRAVYRPALKPVPKPAAQSEQAPFGNIPKGPVQIVISLNQQQLHLYSDGMAIADSPIASGVPQLPTPLGVFSIIQKQRYHESNIYSNAPMPFMERITWSGVALHEGENIGHPASHGCVRLPREFAERLFSLTKLGVPVIIARPELKPTEFADPHLFVHKDAPPPAPPPVPPVAATPDQAAPAAAVASTDPPKVADKTADATADKTAEKIDGKATDAVLPTPIPVAAPVTANADQLGLRVSDTSVAPNLKPDPVKAAPVKPVSKDPIAIFISRKEKKIYVRQNFTPLFSFPVVIADPDKPLGTHIFTALDFTGDDHAALRWNVVSLPGQPPQPARKNDRRAANVRRDDSKAVDLPPPQTPTEALARLDIPQDAIDAISQRIVPGSTLTIADQGLGDETGDGTNFIVETQ